MVVAKLTGRPGETGVPDILILGLSEENVKRLKEGRPIHIKPANYKEVMPDLPEILITYGATELDIKKQMEPYFDKDTIVDIDPRFNTPPTPPK